MAMQTPLKHLYEFGPFQLDPPERLLICDGQPVPMPPKAFDLLVVLVERCGHLIDKDELLKAVWRGSFVEEGYLAVTVSVLRKALNDDRGVHKYIETVSKRGYRFVAEVKRVGEPEVMPGVLAADERSGRREEMLGQDQGSAVPKTVPVGQRRSFGWRILVVAVALGASLVLA